MGGQEDAERGSIRRRHDILVNGPVAYRA